MIAILEIAPMHPWRSHTARKRGCGIILTNMSSASLLVSSCEGFRANVFEGGSRNGLRDIVDLLLSVYCLSGDREGGGFGDAARRNGLLEANATGIPEAFAEAMRWSARREEY